MFKFSSVTHMNFSARAYVNAGDSFLCMCQYPGGMFMRRKRVKPMLFVISLSL